MRALAMTLAGVLAAAPAHAASVHTEPAPEPAPEPAAPAGELAAAEALHIEADAKYNTSDYEGAIESWQKAFAALPRTTEANPYRSLILYNIAAAYEKLFELRNDVVYLKQAKANLQKFESSIDETYASAPEEGAKERAQVEAKIAHIDELIAKAELAEPAAKPPADEPTKPEAPPAAPKRDRGRELLIGGGVLLGVGLIAGAGMGAAMAVGNDANSLAGLEDDDFDGRKDRFDRGRAANAGAITAGVLAAVCIASGIALVVVGAKRRTPKTALAPIVGRGLAGFAFGGRF